VLGIIAIQSLVKVKQGVTFTTFDDIPSLYEFITHGTPKLNDLDLTDEQRQAIVDSNLVF
jgi:heme oxygenase